MGGMTDLNLKPRAIAVLVALRAGPMTTTQIKRCIGDTNAEDTHALLCDMITDTIDHVRGDARWYLTHDGLGWLQRNGLDADDSAKLWSAQEHAS